MTRNHSWDLVFQSVTIKKLTQLDLVDTFISDFVLTRITHDAHNLQSLTLHGFLLDSSFASVLFASDRIDDGKHTLLPYLEVVRFKFLNRDDQRPLYHSVASFLRKREKLRRLDLGSCPWDIVQDILPDLVNLRVLGVHISDLSQGMINSLVESIPTQMVAIRLSVNVSDIPLVYFLSYLMSTN